MAISYFLRNLRIILYILDQKLIIFCSLCVLAQNSEYLTMQWYFEFLAKRKDQEFPMEVPGQTLRKISEALINLSTIYAGSSFEF